MHREAYRRRPGSEGPPGPEVEQMSPKDVKVAVRGWIETTDQEGKVVDLESPDMKKLVAKIAIGNYFAAERLPLHILKLSDVKQSAYLDAVNKRLTEKLTLGLRRKGFQIAAVHSDKAAAQQLKSLVDQAAPPEDVTNDVAQRGAPAFKFEEAG